MSAAGRGRFDHGKADRRGSARPCLGAHAVAEHAHTHGRKRTDSFGIRDVVQARWLRASLREPECDATGCRAGVEGWVSQAGWPQAGHGVPGLVLSQIKEDGTVLAIVICVGWS